MNPRENNASDSTHPAHDPETTSSLAWHADALREAERLVKTGQAKFSDWAEAKARIHRATIRLDSQCARPSS